MDKDKGKDKVKKKKDDLIKFRIPAEQKKLFVDYAKSIGISLTELVTISTEKEIEKGLKKQGAKKYIEERANKTEVKISELKEKMTERSEKSHEGFLKRLKGKHK